MKEPSGNFKNFILEVERQESAGYRAAYHEPGEALPPFSSFRCSG